VIEDKASEAGKDNLTNESAAVCRICWCGEEPSNAEDPEDINPLISPCHCTGTISTIHLKCLRGWLQTKSTKRTHRKQVVIKFKKLDCELCKQNFPFKITYNNRIIDVVTVDHPKTNFIVFESLTS
jgi:E3 ubiquitin-protein ligase DOA10